MEQVSPAEGCLARASPQAEEGLGTAQHVPLTPLLQLGGSFAGGE